MTSLLPITKATFTLSTHTTIPYIRDTSEAIRRILSPLGIRTTFHPTNTLRRLLVHPKPLSLFCELVMPVYGVDAFQSHCHLQSVMLFSAKFYIPYMNDTYNQIAALTTIPKSRPAHPHWISQQTTEGKVHSSGHALNFLEAALVKEFFLVQCHHQHGLLRTVTWPNVGHMDVAKG